MTLQDTLTDRYGAPAPWRRRALVLASALLALVFLVWLGWTAWAHSTPPVDSELESFSIDGQHEATAVIAIRLRDDDVRASCKVRAFAEDHTTVGEKSFSPESAGDRRQIVAIRTEREATSIELLGCTAPGQPRPR